MRSAQSPNPQPSTATVGKIAAAFAAIYVIWGSTYLAIQWAVATIPPFLMAGARFTIAGAALYAYARWRGVPRPSLANWRAAGVAGSLLLLGGNGCVCWALPRLPSGVASLFIATTPLWIVGFDWLRRGGQRPSLQSTIGLLVGFVGLLVLVGRGRAASQDSVDPLAAGALILGPISWAAGSIYSRSAPLPRSSILSVGMQQLLGGVLMGAAGLALGELPRLDLGSVSLRSWLSFVYLMTVGSIVAFTAYVWLLQKVSAAKVATYAYVNPVVALLLGWLLNGERLTPRALVAACGILSAVVVITLDRIRDGGRPAADPPTAPDAVDAVAVVAAVAELQPGSPTKPL